MTLNSSEATILINARANVGPASIGLTLSGISGELLNDAHLRRRWGPFMSGPVRGDEDILINLRTSDLKADQRPGFNTLTPQRTDQGWRLQRDDIDAALMPSVLTVEGETRPRLPAVEECARLLLWLYLSTACEGGLLVHSATVVKEGVAYCFPAYGGTGKSTLARLTPGDLALSDELSLLTLEDGQWRAWPSPLWNWPRQFVGDASRGYPLGGMGFLRQAPMTAFKPLKADEALTQLMAQTVAFDALPKASATTFNLAADLVEALRKRGQVGQLNLVKGEGPFVAFTQ